MTAAAFERTGARADPLDVVARNASLRWAVALVIAAAFYAICHPYLGIVGDANLYLGRALADLDPQGVGRDIAFALDGQSRFSIFSRLADPLVAALGAERAGRVIAIAACASVFAGTLALACALGSNRRLTIAIVVMAAVMPTGYGAGIISFAETNAVPRPFAEAAVMVAIAAMITGKPVFAGLFLVPAVLVHPLMAMAGVGTVLVLMAWRRDARSSLAIVSAIAGASAFAMALGAAGVPLLDRLVVRIDPDWLDMLVVRSPYLFPSHWLASEFAAPAVQTATIVLAVKYVRPEARRVLVAVAISALVQLAMSAVLGDALDLLLPIQVQGWRALWLLAMVATLCLPMVVVDLWREGAQARVALALIGMAWLCPLGLPVSVALCGIALLLRAGLVSLPIRPAHAMWVLVTVGCVALVCGVLKTVGWAELIAQGPGDTATAWILALHSNLLVPPVWLAVVIGLVAGPRRVDRATLGGAGDGRIGYGSAVLGLTVLVAVAATAWNWEERGSTAIWGNQDGFPATTGLPGSHSSEILVVGGLTGSWFALARPQYLSAYQAASIVFSRPLAMEWRRRATALSALGLAAHNVFRPWDRLNAEDPVLVTEAKLKNFCARSDAPAAVIVPDRDDVPAPRLEGATEWKAGSPLPILENYSPLQWHQILGWVVVPCTVMRSTAALAKPVAR